MSDHRSVFGSVEREMCNCHHISDVSLIVVVLLASYAVHWLCGQLIVEWLCSKHLMMQWCVFNVLIT